LLGLECPACVFCEQRTAAWQQTVKADATTSPQQKIISLCSNGNASPYWVCPSYCRDRR